MFTKITYYLLIGWVWLHAFLPLRLLYVLSDILYFIVHYVIRYRLKTVRRNLANSFPEKTEKERRIIEKEFYHHLCDYIVETLKLLHISDKEIQERFEFKNTEQFREHMTQNSVLLYIGHYGNWEWLTSIPLLLDKNDPDMIAVQIYKPLKNKAFDEIFKKIRGGFDSIGIKKNDTIRSIVRLKNGGKRMVLGFISDQTPSPHNIHYWTTFLNQETPVFTGAERIAKSTGFVVYYLDVQKVGRGKYIGEFQLFTDSPKDEPEFSLTERYIRTLEKTILRQPAYWLWSHNRWKYTKQS